MRIRKIMAATLAFTTLISATMTVSAADCSGGSGSGATTTTTTTTTTSSSTGESSSTTSDESTVSFFDASKILSASSKVNVGGKSIVTTVAGAYFAEKVNGVAITTPVDELASKLNLASGQKAYVMVYDFDSKKSNLAMNSINIAAEVLGADFVTAINVNLGAKQNGKFVALPDGSVKMVVGIPKIAIDSSKTYSVVGIQPGGTITYYEDLDDDLQTVTFEVKTGIGAYAILAK